LYFDEAKIENAFKTGEGVSLGDSRSYCLFCGTENSLAHPIRR
jgi:hypothetical protein